MTLHVLAMKDALSLPGSTDFQGRAFFGFSVLASTGRLTVLTAPSRRPLLGSKWNGTMSDCVF